MPVDATLLLAELDARLRPLHVEVSRAWWAANTDASPETDARKVAAELALRAALAEPGPYAAVNEALAAPDLDPVVRRQLEVFRHDMQPNQLDDRTRTRLVELESAVESEFNTHRGEIDGERVPDNVINEILATSGDAALRRKAWEASKSVGEVVADRVVELVRLRNEAARSLGFPGHYEMALALEELDDDRLVATLDEVERLTDAPFRAWKADLDERLAARFDCPPAELRPWHYFDPFFQEPPPVTGLDLDGVFAGADVEALTLRTYEGIGLDVAPVMDRSDLYPREGKCQHAFCVDVDRGGDVRVLCNVEPNERWMETMLHEFGHAAYDRYIDHSLPFSLRRAAHMLTTEAVAMLFGRLSRDPEWLAGVAGMGEAVEGVRDGLGDGQRAGALVFARWALVMCHFERGLYRDPGADHASRWWDLVERLQLVARPEGRTAPDWAAKIHLAVAPVYYQNYLYGELTASQLAAALRSAAGGVVDRPEAGRWLVERFFAPGASVRWDRLVEQATGEPLTARHYAAELAGERVA